jgi:lysophospholipase L1-like esterase
MGKKIIITQLYFLVPGFFMLFLSECVRNISWLRTFATKKLTEKILLALLILIQPLYMFECALDPFTPEPEGTIFIQDRELGWKLKPNSEGLWGPSSTKVKINGKGLRGMELNYAKPAKVTRILYLGDSVTFGYGIKNYKDTFPYQVEAILEKDIGRDIETINAGIGGYSPWQEYLYLSREGTKYNPDLVVVAFVLNDVTEKFELIRFGGSSIGFQLGFKQWSARLLRGGSVMYFTRKLAGRIRFGKNVQEGAKKKEVVDVRSLVFQPDHPNVDRAWNITLENVGKILRLCEDHHFQVVLVVFPFVFQFDDVDSRSAPQHRISLFARNLGIPTLDLLPKLTEKLKEERKIPEDYFWDQDHLTPLGAKRVAEIISEFIQKEGIIKSSD